MKWLGYSRVALKSLHVDAADIRKRMKAAHVADLASDIRARGEEPIHAPTIRAGDKRLLCGRDRVAALLALKAAKVWCHVVECDDIEAKELELAENIYRRPTDNRAELIAQLVALKEQQLRTNPQLTQRDSGDTVTPVRGGNDPVKTQARREVAKAAGMSPASVKRAEMRAKKDSAAGEDSPAPPTSRDEPAAAEPITLDLLGVDDDSTRAVCKFARTYQEAIDEADKHLRLALAGLKRIELTQLGQELRAQVSRVGELVRSTRPEFICPWCKGLPKATVGPCAGCSGQGFVSAEKRGRAPRELCDPAGKLVALDGKFYRYEDVRGGAVKRGTNGVTKPAKKIAVVDEQGDPFSLQDEEATLQEELSVEYDEG